MDPATRTSPWRPDLFDGKKVLITGGSSGIGYGIAHGFAAHGAHVIITGRDKDKLATAVNGLLNYHDYVEGHAFDVRDRDAVNQVADTLKDAFGPLDVLVNNAAGNFLSTWLSMSENAWDSVIDIVLNGTANVTRAFGEPMFMDGISKKMMGQPYPDRSVINIVAGYAWTGAAGVSHSGAAKAAVQNLSKSLATEWGPAGVRVNTIAPGPIEGTGGSAKLWDGAEGKDGQPSMDPEQKEKMEKMLLRSVPLGRTGTIDEMGQAALFLASPAASYVTGTCLVADGGMDAVGPFPWMGHMANKMALAKAQGRHA